MNILAHNRDESSHVPTRSLLVAQHTFFARNQILFKNVQISGVHLVPTKPFVGRKK